MYLIRIPAASVWMLLFVCWIVVGPPQAIAQSTSIRGFVTAQSDAEPLAGVHVILRDAAGVEHGVISNADGFYIFSDLDPGRYQLRASFLGFATFVDTLAVGAGERLLFNFAMTTAALELDEIAIEAEREHGAARVTAGHQTVRPEEIELIPAPDISGDLASYLSTIPGIVMMGDRGGQLFIRGGEPAHNLTLLDGMYLYQPFHVLGFYSAFPSKIISQADVYAGGFGSKFTGRISSVIDVQTRNGNKRALSATASVSPFTSSTLVEGPILPGAISFLGAARFSLLDQIASHYVNSPLPYRFNDAFGKIHATIAGNHQIAISGLRTYDRGRLNSGVDVLELHDDIRWRNSAFGMRYLVAPHAASVLTEVLISMSRLHAELGPNDEPVRSSEIESVNAALNMTVYVQPLEVRWGAFLREYRLDTRLGGFYQNLAADVQRSTNAGGYIEPELNLGHGLRLRPGISAQVYGTRGLFLEPRFRVTWEQGIHHWSAAAGLYRQDIVGIADRRDATNIFTAWLETPFGQALRSVHFLLGYRIATAAGLDLSIEGFHKSMQNLFVGEWTSFPRFTTRLQEAHGRAAGFDVRFEVRRPQFYGFVNYGYSWTRYEIEPEDEAAIDYGPYRPPHDRRHQVNVLASTRLYGFDLSVRWQFGSGLPYTPVQGFDGFILMDGAVNVHEIRGFPRVIYEDVPYRAELPTYHRLDVTADRTFTPASGLDVTLQLGAINVYDRANLFSLDLFTAQRSDQLPFVPTAGLKIEF